MQWKKYKLIICSTVTVCSLAFFLTSTSSVNGQPIKNVSESSFKNISSVVIMERHRDSEADTPLVDLQTLENHFSSFSKQTASTNPSFLDYKNEADFVQKNAIKLREKIETNERVSVSNLDKEINAFGKENNIRFVIIGVEKDTKFAFYLFDTTNRASWIQTFNIDANQSIEENTEDMVAILNHSLCINKANIHKHFCNESLITNVQGLPKTPLQVDSVK